MKIFYDARAVSESGIGSYARHLVTDMRQLVTQDEFVEGPTMVALDWEHGTQRYSAAVHRLYWENVLLPDLLKNENFDVLHNVRNYGVPFRTKCPVVLTLHDLIPLIYEKVYLPSWKERWIYKKLLQHAVEKADAIISISMSARQDILKFFPLAVANPGKTFPA